MTTQQLLTEVETLFWPRSVWQALVGTATQTLSPTERQLTHWILFELHNRHVGIPVDMAIKTAQLLASHSQNTFSPWDQISTELSKTLKTLDNVPALTDQLINHGILLHTNPRFVVLDLLLPIVVRACQTVRQNILFCADHFDKEPFDAPEYMRQRGAARLDSPDTLAPYRTTYKDYSNQFIKAVLGVVAGIEAIFWKDRLYTLFSLSQMTPDDDAQPPALQLHTARIFLEHQPDMTKHTDWSQRSIEMAESPIVKSLLFEDAGVEGVTISRDVEQANRMLLSEWFNMVLSDDDDLDIMWLDRMVNDGYGITERPPYWIQLRDTLIVGIYPNMGRTQATGMFAKTVWFEFALRMSRLLQHNKLTLSELRWVEGNQTQDMRSQAILVEFLPQMSGDIENKDHAAQLRHRFLKAAGWFPAYLDPRERFKPLKELSDDLLSGTDEADMTTEENGSVQPTRQPDNPTDAMERLLSSSTDWMVEAWRARREVAQWAEFRDIHGSYKSRELDTTPANLQFGNEKLDLSSFAFHHVMLFLPMSLYRFLDKQPKDSRASQERGTSYQSWIHLFDQVKNLSITWIPDSFAPEQSEWRFSGYEATDKLIWAADADSKVTLGELSARLLESWSEVLVKEMQRE